jgi:DNA-nicking Smr family endonuclease
MATRYSLADLKVVRKELLRRAQAEQLARERAAEEAAARALQEQLERQRIAVAAADVALFRQVLVDVTPLPPSDYAMAAATQRLSPVPRQRLADERRVVGELLQPVTDWEPDTETGESLTFLRHGLPREILRKLRRGQWVVQSTIDLHGMDREEARLALSDFLQAALHNGHRCVRVIHGKGLGSRNREPILKHKVKRFLQQREEVLAFVEARNVDGGGGVALVLLKSPGR